MERKINPGINQLVQNIMAAMPPGITHRQFNRAAQYVSGKLSSGPNPHPPETRKGSKKKK